VSIISASLSVAEQGLRFLNEKQRTKYQKKLAELLQELRDYENKVYPDYTDSDIGLLHESLEDFLVSFGSELRKADLENMRDK